ncbi:hypothetical protein J6590_104760 [Homalodisca vitripennis]|nr:hypothetical protein J6590_104760 [Homalodisca vitripennis]
MSMVVLVSFSRCFIVRNICSSTVRVFYCGPVSLQTTTHRPAQQSVQRGFVVFLGCRSRSTSCRSLLSVPSHKPVHSRRFDLIFDLYCFSLVKLPGTTCGTALFRGSCGLGPDFFIGGLFPPDCKPSSVLLCNPLMRIDLK